MELKFVNLICEHKKTEQILCAWWSWFAGTGAKFIRNTSQDRTYDKCLKYLKERPSVDYFAYSDGKFLFVKW